jgi:hypothetical protein
MSADDDEDDYMSMVIEEPRTKETFSQRKLRLQREVGSSPLPLFPSSCTTVLLNTN